MVLFVPPRPRRLQQLVASRLLPVSFRHCQKRCMRDVRGVDLLSICCSGPLLTYKSSCRFRAALLQARKLMKELQAQLAAADASAALDACMARRPCGSAALKAAIAKAEAAAAAIAGAATQTSSGAASASASSAHSSSSGSSATAAAGCAGFGEALLARLQAGKKRLEVERACEALHKASLAHRGVGELPKLEAAILNARKVRGAGAAVTPSMCSLHLHPAG